MPSNNYAKAIKKVREENPDVPSDVSVEPAGFFGKLLMGRGQATTNPWTGNITYNPEKLNLLNPAEAENVFAHELTHSRQIRNTPFTGRLMNLARFMIPGMEESYYRRPRELEAFQTEMDRTARLGLSARNPMTGRGDIELPVSPRRKMIDYFAQERRRRGLE